MKSRQWKTEKGKTNGTARFRFRLSALRFALCASLLSTFCISAFALTNPYDGIVQRNVFDVHPVIAPPPGPEKPPGPPPPTIKLNGITDILGKKQVLLKAMMPAKPPAGPKEEAMVLTEGQRQGEIEVISIDVKAGVVVVNDYGTITNLSLEANAEKLNSTGPVPGTVPMPRGGVPPPAGMPAMPQPVMPGRLPQRTLRLPGQTQSNPGNQGYGSPGYGLPNYQQQNQQPQLSADEQILSVEAQRLKAQQENNPIQNILPPMPPSYQKSLGIQQPATPPMPQ